MPGARASRISYAQTPLQRYRVLNTALHVHETLRLAALTYKRKSVPS
jgi:hypothetical protein